MNQPRRHVAAAVTLAALAATAACAARAEPAPPITVRGVVALDAGQFDWNPYGLGCYGQGGYSDLAEGARVVITNGKGETVGVGKLRDGRVDYGEDYEHAVCELAFVVNDVPSGHGFYGVEVTTRGTVKFSEEEVQKGVKLTIG